MWKIPKQLLLWSAKWEKGGGSIAFHINIKMGRLWLAISIRKIITNAYIQNTKILLIWVQLFHPLNGIISGPYNIYQYSVKENISKQNKGFFTLANSRTDQGNIFNRPVYIQDCSHPMHLRATPWLHIFQVLSTNQSVIPSPLFIETHFSVRKCYCFTNVPQPFGQH